MRHLLSFTVLHTYISVLTVSYVATSKGVFVDSVTEICMYSSTVFPYFRASISNLSHIIRNKKSS
jgi:uncharacterized membrane protein